MSKRKMLRLVEEGHVNGWDDPRMPTLQGMRRRGFSPQSILDFSERVGVAKRENVIEVELLEHCLRQDLNKKAQRRLGVLNPLKLTIENYPDDQSEEMDAVNNPEDSNAGTRKVPFSKNIFIDHNDFMEDPPKKYFRLAPGKEVRLKYAYYVTCKEVIKDNNGEVTEIICSYDPDSRGGDTADGRKVKGTIQWVDAETAIPTKVRLYDRLFSVPNPEDVSDGVDFTENINPDSLHTLESCLTESNLCDIKAGSPFQLERIGYFCKDPDSNSESQLILNRTVALRDSWGKSNKS
jgi:glutaminyl-tRNA synthetase